MTGKQYVEVAANFLTDGTLKPLWITWADGRKLEISKILDVRPAASMKAGGTGIRYLCRICGKDRYLFFEQNRWFVEYP